MLLNKKADLTKRNKINRSAIDLANTKEIISIYQQFLSGMIQQSEEERKKTNTPIAVHHLQRSPSPGNITPTSGVDNTGSKENVYEKMGVAMLQENYAGGKGIRSKQLSGKYSPRYGIESGSPRQTTDKEIPMKWSRAPSPGSSPTRAYVPCTGGAPDKEKIGLQSFAPIQLLGKGSFGEVYLVKKRSSGNYYAMKVLSKDKILKQNLTKYAITEKNVLSNFHHPFIVGLNTAFQTASKLFLVLDYCPGGDLGQAIQREKKFSIERARIYLAEVLLALEDLHKREIIYRDLKPDNVILDSEGHALLTDFGLSKEGISNTDLTQSFCGSVAYLAPEMLRRAGHGKSVDWYLLGVLLYEMIIGIPPYFNRNRDKLFENIKRGPLYIPPGTPDVATQLIVKLLNRDPNKRLGAGCDDAEEIKKDPFFKGVNWDDVLARKLKPPKPIVKPIPNVELSLDIFGCASPSKYENKIERWTFVKEGLC